MTLREHRIAKGLTVKFVANYLGLAPATLTLKERNNKFSLAQIKLLTQLYHIEVNDISGLE